MRKSFLVSALVAGFWNFIMMVVCNSIIKVTIPVAMETGRYTADEFISICVFMAIGAMCLGNVALAKTGIYHSIKLHVGE